jgi:hypothetical protein
MAKVYFIIDEENGIQTRTKSNQVAKISRRKQPMPDLEAELEIILLTWIDSLARAFPPLSSQPLHQLPLSELLHEKLSHYDNKSILLGLHRLSLHPYLDKPVDSQTLGRWATMVGVNDRWLLTSEVLPYLIRNNFRLSPEGHKHLEQLQRGLSETEPAAPSPFDPTHDQLPYELPERWQ